MKRTAIAGLLALASVSAQAAQDLPGIRAGVAGSFSHFEGDDVPDPTLDAKFIDDNAVGFKLFGQYRFNQWFGIEGAYHNISDFEDETPNDFPPNTLKLNFNGFSAQGVLYAPSFAEDFEAFAKAGYYDFSDELSVEHGHHVELQRARAWWPAPVSNSGSATALSVRAEYEWFDAEVGDLQSRKSRFCMAFWREGRSRAGGCGRCRGAGGGGCRSPPPPPPPPADSDGDGVTDDKDACPGTPAGARVNARGCEEQLVLQGVTFENNSDRLTPNSTLTLDSVAEILKQRPNFTIEVRGHTDSTGSDEYNMNLSQRRADSVMEYLVSRGVPAGRLSAVGFGETQPVAPTTPRKGARRIAAWLWNSRRATEPDGVMPGPAFH